MSSTEFNLDTFLDDKSSSFLDQELSNYPKSEGNSAVPYREPGYEGSIDYRIRQLSYSALNVFHSCKRKFQLNRLKTTYRSEQSEEANITFAYGHIIGDGIQKILEGKSEQEVILAAFLGWHAPLLAIDEKRKKSFWSAIIALQKFISLRESGFLDEYEVLTYNNKLATELNFKITLPDGFNFRGSVDAVLIHKTTRRILVLECKTTWQRDVNPAMYKNSSQAIGYSIVLDVVFPGVTEYDVLYLVYSSVTREYLQFKFLKSYVQRAIWIRELMMDVEIIKFCEEQELYPKNGDACLSFGKECEYINHCGLDTSLITKHCTEKEADTKEYQINISLLDLLNTQLEKVGN